MNGELSEDTKLMLLHPELIPPVMSCVVRFHHKAGKLPEFCLYRWRSGTVSVGHGSSRECSLFAIQN
jgi:hypothetical protein